MLSPWFRGCHSLGVSQAQSPQLQICACWVCITLFEDMLIEWYILHKHGFVLNMLTMFNKEINQQCFISLHLFSPVPPSVMEEWQHPTRSNLHSHRGVLLKGGKTQGSRLKYLLTFANYSSHKTTPKVMGCCISASVIMAVGEPTAPPSGY